MPRNQCGTPATRNFLRWRIGRGKSSRCTRWFRDFHGKSRQQALSHSSASNNEGGWWFGGGHLYQVALRPIQLRGESSKMYLGTVVVGREIDSGVAAEVARIALCQVAFRYGDEAVVSSLSTMDDAMVAMGSVGKPQPNVEVKFAEDGELLVQGPTVFAGYWHKPEANAECFDAEGWFKTGDIGHLDQDGFLYITDRKKELLKTSGGKLVAPQPIENKLKNSILVGQAALVGDKHKFVSAIISPNFSALEEWARAREIRARTRAELLNDKRVVALYDALVKEVNAGLANFETIKRFRLVPDEWSQESGELTPSMKLKRRVITERYSGVVTELYADEATAHAAK